MKTETIVVANMKCGGCATTIKNELLKVNGVKTVEVSLENDAIEVGYETDNHKEVITKLHSLGYPEATAENGLLLQLKSYTSCMVGKMNNL